MPDERQAQILRAVVKEYIRYARPVSSNAIAKKQRPNLSSATVRNEFAELTREGYLTKPHISAGRLPTNRGYRYYVDTEILRGSPADTRETRAPENDLAELAQMLAEYSGLLAGVWREDDETMIRGFKQILAQPEFTAHEASIRIAELMDDLPRMFEKFFSLDSASGIFIGEECPFWDNDDTSIIFRKVRFPSKARGIECIIGPTRMSYETNWELLG